MLIDHIHGKLIWIAIEVQCCIDRKSERQALEHSHSLHCTDIVIKRILPLGHSCLNLVIIEIRVPFTHRMNHLMISTALTIVEVERIAENNLVLTWIVFGATAGLAALAC